MIDVSTLTLPESQTETRTFTSAKQGGKGFALTLNTAPDLPDKLAAADYAQKYTQQFVTGGKVNGKWSPPAVFPPIGPEGKQKAVRITPLLCQTVGALMALQCEEKNNTFLDWVIFAAAADDAMEQMAEWAGEILDSAPDDDADGALSDPNG